MQLSTAIPKLGAVGYAEWRPAMRAALVVQRAWAVVRDGVDEAEDEELLALEADFNEADIVRQVLTGLRNDDRYTTTVKVITYSSELPDLTKLTEMLVEEERQLEPLATAGRRHGGDGIAFAAQTSTGRFTKPPKKCWICDKVGHIALHCPEATCFSCGQRGHMVRNCPKKQGARANAAVAF